MDGFVVPLGNCLQLYQRQEAAGERLHRRVEPEKTFFSSSKNLARKKHTTNQSFSVSNHVRLRQQKNLLKGKL